MLIDRNTFLFSFFAKKKRNGIITYISKSADNPKNITLLRQTNPPIFPKFNIS